MASKAELACVYSALILCDDDVAVTAEKMATILKAANVTIEPYWPAAAEAKKEEAKDESESDEDMGFVKDDKGIPTIEKILSTDKPEDGVDPFEETRRSALDQALREYLLRLLTKSEDEIKEIVSWSIDLGKQGLCTASMPSVLLSDALEMLPIDQCESLFSILEEKVEVWKLEPFFSACKNNLLRLCNDLLRRLSKSQNTVFCGRILLFLAKFFPFSERSGLNIIGEFNLENLTAYGDDSRDDGELVAMETNGEAHEDTKPQNVVSFNLYCKFWALQDFFRNPAQCYNRLPWKKFVQHTNEVLEALGSMRLDVQHFRHTSDAPQNYFPKYLTNGKLLDLQLNDGKFRRYVLVQFIIIFHYLQSPVKFKNEKQLLTDEQVEWVKQTTEKIYKLIAETPPEGEKFLQSVKHFIKREDLWNSWKNDGCPKLQPPTAKVSESDQKKTTNADASNLSPGKEHKRLKRPRRPLGDQIKDAVARKKFNLGNPALTRLWNLNPDNLAGCRSQDRKFVPSMEDYFAEAIEQLNPKAQIEPQYKKVNNADFQWRALRLLAAQSPHFFMQNQLIFPSKEFLEMTLQKVAKELPRFQHQEDDDDEEEEEQEMEEEDTEDAKKLKPEEEKTVEGGNPSRVTLVDDGIIGKLAPVLGNNWKVLAKKLGMKDDEIEYFENQKPDSATEQAEAMLKTWVDSDPEDATVETLYYWLEGLQLSDALKAAFPSSS
ncbi:unnamed protein product [Darwinula stevensoni]|uniref:Large ribosomal subunit protein P2 n=1 Tax=Darwinula stevensoni TaxID=69355 RepID=A0A7R8XH90_9CRUS|nr:unnamed protein product [Darwinula stevensoni]CAG0893297.1 unnamed protein product [Darwinula stevensoni]